MDPNIQATLEKLQKIRARTDLSIRPTALLRKTFLAPGGVEKPLTLRYYQVQMVLHLMAMRRFIVGDDTGCGKCQPYDTMILTDQGLLKMGEIEDWSSMSPDTFRPMSRKVHVLVDGERLPIKNFYYGGVKPTIKVTTRYGFSTTGSRVHPVLVLRGGKHEWVQTPNLREGDYLCIERREMGFPDQESILVPGVQDRMTPDLARFLGYYIGEGSLTSKYQVRISQSPEKNPEVHADIIRLFGELFGEMPHRLDGSELYLGSKNHRDWLMLNGCGYTLSPEREIPRCILQSSRESSREFLRALFEGEGHAGKGCIEFSTASKELGRQVQIMLLRFGIVANRSPKKVNAYPDRTYWRLTISGEDAQRFHDQLGFISSRKQKALALCLDRPRNSNHDVVPESRWIFERARDELKAATSRVGDNSIRSGSGLKQFGTSLVNTLINIRNFNRNPTYDFIEKLVEILTTWAPGSESLPLLKGLLTTRYFYDPVVSLEEGAEEVFDIEVGDPRHCFVGNGILNHNTIESIASLCYLWEKQPDLKVLVLTKKSAVRQWQDEFRKFTTGVKVVVCRGTPKQRAETRDEFFLSDGPTVLIMGHRSAVQDFTHLQDREWGVLVLDEATVAKTPSTQIHQVCRHLSMQSQRAWGLTATLIKNNLVEGYGIFKAIEPDLFKHTLNAFIDDYCVTQLIPIGRGRKVKRIVGYRKSDVERFRLKIEPFYLGRPKHAVATELPVLTSKRVRVGMSSVQHLKYQEALAGLLMVGEDEKEVSKLTAVTYCQEIVNHPLLIQTEGESEKLDELVELLTEGDLEGEKVIVFTRFEKMVGLGIKALEAKGVKCARITGKETKEDDRKAAQDIFQDPNSDVKVIWITTAGSDAINLQMAKAIVFYDTPFSAGDYLQTLGRMIRIGSIHDRVLALHLVCEGTIDERVLDIMDTKMGLLEAVLGKRIKGEDDTDEMISAEEGSIDALFDALRDDARGLLSA